MEKSQYKNSIKKTDLKTDIVKGHPLYQKIKDNFKITCALFGINYDVSNLRVRENAISGYDSNKKEIVTFVHEKDKTILMVYDAPEGKPVKLLNIKYTTV